MDVLSNPPASGKYNNSKETLLDIYDLSRRGMVRKVVHINGLGDQKPSELMDYNTVPHSDSHREQSVVSSYGADFP